MKCNCWDCKGKGEVVDSTHIKCLIALQELEIDTEHPLNMLVLLLGGVSIKPKDIDPKNGKVIFEIKGKKVVVDLHGYKHGWASFPFNFDPVWIDECELYQPKQGSE